MSPYKSPLEGYENAEPLPTTVNADGKSLNNPPGPRSAAYDEFPKPIDSSNNGFDFHSEYATPYVTTSQLPSIIPPF
ncbi:hypothetical protein HGRIS_004907 [Hohenbuehelia grisea]|uniref:Uncharacterized protein n=1 Tax=Hohenbuehelia grisea TaxID=104357 RepID=A0ABR3JE75_9AGAR